MKCRAALTSAMRATGGLSRFRGSRGSLSKEALVVMAHAVGDGACFALVNAAHDPTLTEISIKTAL